MAVPEQTTEQKKAALEKAMGLRTERAKFKAAMKRGDKTLADALGEPVMQRCKVVDAIRAMPGYGKARAEKLMAALKIATGRRIGGLGARQREALLKAFE